MGVAGIVAFLPLQVCSRHTAQRIGELQVGGGEDHEWCGWRPPSRGSLTLASRPPACPAPQDFKIVKMNDLRRNMVVADAKFESELRRQFPGQQQQPRKQPRPQREVSKAAEEIREALGMPAN